MIVRAGPCDLPAADVAFLHADCTEIPAEYTDALSRYPAAVNGTTGDVTKRAISRHLVTSATEYQGPVIVKTNRNSGGFPEALHASVALEERGEVSPPVRYMKGRYPIFESPCHVPAHVFGDPDLVVEKFLPEKDERGYYVRYWVFLGDRERCSRYLEGQPIVKGDNALERVPVPVPDELREWRKRLGFDYGKFDFVVRDGVPILLDVNRTPTVPAAEPHGGREARAGGAGSGDRRVPCAGVVRSGTGSFRSSSGSPDSGPAQVPRSWKAVPSVTYVLLGPHPQVQPLDHDAVSA